MTTAAAARRVADSWEPVVSAFVRRDGSVGVQGTGPGRLGGLTVSLKDNVSVAGQTMSAGSSWWRHCPERDAVVWARLRDAGAQLVGSTNMHEFAYGASTVNEHALTTRNPWDPRRIAGGSSGGSAASVSVGAADLSVGTDTGGSVRIPAALCGVTGFKPTYGSVSSAGVLPLSPSMDHVGLIAVTAERVRRAWEVVADRRPAPARPLMAGRPLEGLRVGVLSDHMADATTGVWGPVLAAIELLGLLGAVLEPAVLPDEAEASAAASTMVAFEAAQLHRAWLASAASQYGSDVRARLERGARVTPRQYRAARRDRSRLAERLRKAQRAWDVVAGPAVPIVAPTVADVQGDHDGRIQARLLRATYLFDVTGQPAITIPCGVDAAGLPVGLQLAAATGRDAELLDVARAVQAETDWHHRRPRLRSDMA